MARPASRTGRETLLAVLNLSETSCKANWNDFNQIMRDCPTDTYDAMLGFGVKPGWY